MTERTATTITLDTPIPRGDTTIASVELRRPKSGELRGVQLVNLLHMDVAALEIILPRLTSPALTRQDVAALDPADLTQFGMEVAGFLLTKATRTDFPNA